MNGINHIRDDGFKTSVEMGLSSILGMLASIDEGVENITKTFKEIFISPNNNKDNDYTRLSYETLSAINLTLSDYFKKSSKLLGSKNKNEESNNKNTGQMGFGPGMMIDKYYNISFGGIKERSLKRLEPVLIHLEKIVSKSKQLMDVSKSLSDIKDTLAGMDNLLIKVGKGMLFLSLGLGALQFVSVANIFKITMILPLFALNLALFINIIMAATSKIGGGVGGFFKFGMLMFTIKDIFTDIGKGVAIMSLGLYLLEKVSWEAVLKLGVVFGSIGGLFHLLKGSEVAEFSVILSLAFMLWTVTSALKSMEKVSWDSVLQLPTFLLLLGIALRYGGYNEVKTINSMSMLGIGFLLVTASLMLFNEIPWTSVFQYPLFIGGLGLALRAYQKNTDLTSMSVIAAGLLLMTIALLNFSKVDITSIVGVIAVLGVLGLVVSKFFGNGNNSILITSINRNKSKGMGAMGMLGLAIGLGLLTLSFQAFSEVQWSSVWKGLMVITVLGIVVKSFFTTRTGRIIGTKQSVPPMIGFAVGLGLMVLSLDAMSELEWGVIFKFILFTAALGAIFKFLFPRNTKMSGMLGFGIGMSLIILSLDALTEIDWITVFKFVTVIAGIGAVFKYLLGNTGSMKMFAFAVSIGILAIALYNVGKNFNSSILGGITLFALGVSIMGGVMFLLGKFSSQIYPGILAAGGIAIVTWIMGKALKEVYISGTLIASNWMSLAGFTAGVVVTTLIVGLLGLAVANPIVAPILGAGAAAILGLAFVVYVMSVALQKVAEVDYNPEKYRLFGISLGLLVSSIATNVSFLDSIGSFGKSLMLLPLLTVSLLGAGLLWLIGKTMNDNNLPVKINIFTKSLANLVNNFSDNVKGWSVAKGALKTVPVLAILSTLYMGANTVEKISKLEIDENNIIKFNRIFNNLVDSVLITLNNNADRIKDAEPGIRAISKLTKITGGIARMVNDIANLQFTEYTVRNGELVLKSTRPMTERDFQMVGNSLGKLIFALVNPLEVLGGNTPVWKLGGISIKNPFKNSDIQKGISNVKRIGNTFEPLVKTIEKYNSLGMIDSTKSNEFMTSLIYLSRGYKSFFETVNLIDISKASKTINIIEDYNDLWEDVDYKAFKELNGLLSTFVDKFSDQNKWNIIHRNMERMVKNTGNMVKNINGINVDKAKLFEKNVAQLTDKRNFTYLKEVVEQFANMFMIIQHNNAMMMSQQNQYIQTNTDAINTQTKKIEASASNSLASTFAGTKSDKEVNEMFDGWAKGDGRNVTMKIDNIHSDETKQMVSRLDKDKDGILEWSDVQQFMANQNATNEMISVLLTEIMNNKHQL